MKIKPVRKPKKQRCSICRTPTSDLQDGLCAGCWLLKHQNG